MAANSERGRAISDLKDRVKRGDYTIDAAEVAAAVMTLGVGIMAHARLEDLE